LSGVEYAHHTRINEHNPLQTVL